MFELKEIFNNPFNQETSLQVNNKFWPGDHCRLLNLIEDSESYAISGNFIKSFLLLKKLKKYNLSDESIKKIFIRFLKLLQTRSYYGFITGKIKISDDLIVTNASGDTHVTKPDKAIQDELKSLESLVFGLYSREFPDFFYSVNRQVRYAVPDDRLVDSISNGPLSDFHNDESKGITMICYLSRVDEYSGPFEYIEGSQHVRYSLLLKAIHQHLCFDLSVVAPIDMAAFPLEFRSTPALGNFLEDDKVRILMDYKKTLFGDVGSFIAFNGQYLLHRGGKPSKNHRIASFIAPVGLFQNKLKTIRANILGEVLHLFTKKII